MTKLEQVARALDPQAWYDWTVPPRGLENASAAILLAEKRRRQNRAIKQARAAIHAMREPTDEMLTAGYHAQSEATRYSLAEAHQAMIDQALAEDGK